MYLNKVMEIEQVDNSEIDKKSLRCKRKDQTRDHLKIIKEIKCGINQMESLKNKPKTNT